MKIIIIRHAKDKVDEAPIAIETAKGLFGEDATIKSSDFLAETDASSETKAEGLKRADAARTIACSQIRDVKEDRSWLVWNAAPYSDRI